MLLMGALFGLYPFLLKPCADSGYQGAKLQHGLSEVCGRVNLEIVKRSDLHKFVMLLRRWIVERTIGWLNRCRRLTKDWEWHVSACDEVMCYTVRISNKFKELLERAERWPKAAQEEALASLEAIEEDFVVDATFARDLARAREEMLTGQGTPQEEMFERFGV